MSICSHCGKDPNGLTAYRLKKEMPGLGIGAVFVHDRHDRIKGSIGCGCLKLAWDNHNCQHGWCAGTHVLPGQLAGNSDWFEQIPNDGRYTADKPTKG